MINQQISKKLHSKLPVHPILRIVVRSITQFYARHAPIILTHHTTGQIEKTEKLAITHIHTNTDIVTTKNGKQLSSHCSKFTYHVPWMFIFIYTFITSYNRSLLPQLFTGEDSATTNTPPHSVAGGAVSVPFVQQAYALYSV